MKTDWRTDAAIIGIQLAVAVLVFGLWALFGAAS